MFSFDAIRKLKKWDRLTNPFRQNAMGEESWLKMKLENKKSYVLGSYKEFVSGDNVEEIVSSGIWKFKRFEYSYDDDEDEDNEDYSSIFAIKDGLEYNIDLSFHRTVIPDNNIGLITSADVQKIAKKYAKKKLDDFYDMKYFVDGKDHFWIGLQESDDRMCERKIFTHVNDKGEIDAFAVITKDLEKLLER